MKLLNIKLLTMTVALLTATACSVPKVAEQQSLSNLPTDFAGIDSTKGEQFVPINLNTYFNDPVLLQLFEKVRSSNLDYQILQQRILIANSHLKRAKLGLLPSLDILINGSGTHYADYTMEGVGNFDTNLSPNITEEQKINRDVTPNFWIGAQASWEIDVWGRLKNKKNAAKNRFFASQEGLKLLQNQLFSEIAELYYDLISLDKKLEIYERNYAVQQKAYDIILAQRSTGKATELAVQQFSAQSKNLLAQVELVKLEINAKERALLTLLGEFNGEVSRSSDFLMNHVALLNQKLPVDSIIHNRPDVRQSYFELVATNADAKAARAAFFPKLEIGAYAAFNAFSFSTLFNPGSLAWQFLGGIVAPVFNRGQLKQDFYVANREQEIAFLNYQKSVVQSYNELNAILRQVDAFQTIGQIKNEEIRDLERAVEVSNDLYLSGYATYLELISSQKDKLRAELDYVDFQLTNAKSLVLLYKALGGELK